MRHFRSAATLATTLLLMSGCTTAPRYVVPVSSAPAAFVGAGAVDARSAGAGQTDLVDWWRGFHDPLLTSLVKRALAQNLDLQQAGARSTKLVRNGSLNPRHQSTRSA